MKTRLLPWMLSLASVGVTLVTANAQLPAIYKDPTAPIEKRVEDLLSQLTPEEKIDMLSGASGMVFRGNNRLGIPFYKLSDGALGIRCYGPSTAYPNGVALACTWDVDQAERAGIAMGRDSRARGVNIILGPGMNLDRAPMCGRNGEYLGEDPLLAGNMASGFIKGAQSQGVGVTAKHFAANEQDIDRHNLNSEVDERTLRELYLKPFEIVVKNGASGVMTSYNPLNGVHTSQNAWLINTVLKGEWGFKGFVVSDWDSCYDATAMANGGLDIEMPGGRYFNRKKLLPLIASGAVTQAVIDDKVRRILRVGFTYGWFDRPQLDASIPKDDPKSAEVALQGARESVTLLKNTGSLLPADETKVKKVVVLGRNADPAVVGPGGTVYTAPFHSVSVFQGIKNYLGTNADVTLIPWAKPGGRGALDGNGANGTPGVPPEFEEQVKSADLAVVCVGFNNLPGYAFNKQIHDYEGEGANRSYALPPGQVEVIKAVLALNPKTVVILNAGGSVATEGWMDQVPAFLHAYFPGQEGGTAIAEILFGKTNPSGKLAFSWEKRWEDCAAYGNYPTEENRTTNTYKEGVFMGYRWFDSKPALQPLFPFGFGLSYTTFEYSNMKLSAPDAQGNITATATIKNTGARAGAEVVELYVQPPQATVPRPARELKGFTRVELAPGESKTATIHFTRDDLAYWDPATKRWTLTPGAYVASLGSSSRQLLINSTIQLR